jgi:Methylase involved in ubiquinone/menaquinone biosynthesis
MKESANYYTQTRTDVAAFIPKSIKTILDIGCGQGAFLKLVKDQTGAESWGIEMITEVAEIAKGQVDNILVGKIEDVLSSIPDNYFDCITFNDVLEHLIEPTEVLKMIRSKLSQKGIIIASIPNVRHFRNLYELLIKKDWEYKEGGILDSTHLRFFTQKSMKSMFEKAGYIVIKQEGTNKIRSWQFILFNLITFYFFADTYHSQFLNIVQKQ